VAADAEPPAGRAATGLGLSPPPHQATLGLAPDQAARFPLDQATIGLAGREYACKLHFDLNPGAAAPQPVHSPTIEPAPAGAGTYDPIRGAPIGPFVKYR